jgi:hypothetical protein
MKTRFQSFSPALTLFALIILNGSFASAHAQGTAFTYQGRLNNGGTAAAGSYDFRFRLAADNLGNDYVGSAFLTNGVPVTNGLFTTAMDFGANIFTGSNYWLEVDVRTNGAGGYTTLFPLQAVTPAPYAIYAGTANTVVGSISNSALPSSANFSGTITASALAGNGANVTNVNATALNGVTATNFWQLGGNNISAGQVLGSTNNQSVVIAANGMRGLQIIPVATDFSLGVGASNLVNLVGGSHNYLAPGIGGSIILGGGFDFNLHAYTNSVLSSFSVLGSGFYNVIGLGSYGSFLGSGSLNTVDTNAYLSFLGGGTQNTIAMNSYQSFIGGGGQNLIGTNASRSVISGGANNINLAASSFIGGGAGNLIETNASISVIAGGANNGVGMNSTHGVVVGGFQNHILNDSEQAVVVGGEYNNVQSNSPQAVIVGGEQNTIGSTANYSLIGAGYENVIQGNGLGNLIGGGEENTIQAVRDAAIVGGSFNSIQTNASFAFIGAGIANTIQTNSGSTFIGAGEYNTVQINAKDSVIGGGHTNSILLGALYSVIGGGEQNMVLNNADHGFIGGGVQNTIGANSGAATIAGGYLNYINNSGSATIGGGFANFTSGQYATIGGGHTNIANGQYATVGGGDANNILISADHGTIGGGGANSVIGAFGTVPGGINNVAGHYSFAAGRSANATNDATLVWGDGSAATGSTNANSVTLRASGGYRFFTSSGAAGAQLAANGTSWTTISDRNAKKNFQTVDTLAVLDKLAAIPVQEWNYKWEKDNEVPNIGPMAQDFKHAFYPGRDDKGISTLEFDGVELAAIQGLNRKLEAKDAEIQELKARTAKMDSMEKQLAELELQVKSLVEKK